MGKRTDGPNSNRNRLNKVLGITKAQPTAVRKDAPKDEPLAKPAPEGADGPLELNSGADPMQGGAVRTGGSGSGSNDRIPQVVVGDDSDQKKRRGGLSAALGLGV